VRPAYPTASELQRMPWHARQRLRERLTQRPAEEEPQPRTPADLTQSHVTDCHRRYQRGDITPHVEIGEREYQRRRKAAQRKDVVRMPRERRRGPEPGWSVDEALRLKAEGWTWTEIATEFKTSRPTLCRRVQREMQRRRAEEAA
jgi:hypothetical protein